jgi:hypothetical protein
MKTDRAETQARSQLEEILDMVKTLEAARVDDSTSLEDAEAIISEHALSVEVRSLWHEPGGENQPGEYNILLCTGGPAVRLIGELNGYATPETVRMQYQDWATPWEDLVVTDAETEAMLTFATTFYFGG